MKRRNPGENDGRPTPEQTKDLVLRNLSRELIDSGLRAVDSVSIRLMTLSTASSNLLNGKYNEEIGILLEHAKQEASGQASDSKSFSPGLIADLKKVTADILKEIT